MTFPSEDEIQEEAVDIDPEDIPEDATSEDIRRLVEETTQ
jgi:hypothetical protein